jgi:hypothetical protein
MWQLHKDTNYYTELQLMLKPEDGESSTLPPLVPFLLAFLLWLQVLFLIFKYCMVQILDMEQTIQ